MNTKDGSLRIYPAENLAVGLGLVFISFDDPQAAREFIGCNPSFAEWTVESALEELAFQLGKVL